MTARRKVQSSQTKSTFHRPKLHLDHFILLGSSYLFSILLFFLIAHESGSGWVQVAGAAATAVVAIGVIGPPIRLVRCRVVCLDAPVDASARSPFTITVKTSVPITLRPLRPAGPISNLGTNKPTELTIEPKVRGVLDVVQLVQSTGFPFGLSRWSKVIEVALPESIYVSPATGAKAFVPPTSGTDTSTRSWASSITPHGDLRELRSYRPGDLRSKVNWRATAHIGELTVRIDESPFDQRETLVRADLPDDASQAEARAEEVLATVIKLLQDGFLVELETTEAGGQVVSRLVRDPIDAKRRMAKALPMTRASEL